jgi:hypothetical protein
MRAAVLVWMVLRSVTVFPALSLLVINRVAGTRMGGMFG